MSSQTSVSRISHDSDHDEDEDICRVCRCIGTTDNPLFYPCLCSGSIRYIHQECLLKWLEHSNKKSCELCHHPFRFSPVYEVNAPVALPRYEVVLAAARQLLNLALLALRCGVVAGCWLLGVPLATVWLWRLCFVRSVEDLNSHLCVAFSVFSDIFRGACLSATIILFFILSRHIRRLLRLSPEGYYSSVRARGSIDIALTEIQEFSNENEESLSLMEIIGFEGPLRNLSESLFSVMASTAIFLGIMVLLPLFLGRTTQSWFPIASHLIIRWLNSFSLFSFWTLNGTDVSLSFWWKYSEDFFIMLIGYVIIFAVIIIFIFAATFIAIVDKNQRRRRLTEDATRSESAEDVPLISQILVTLMEVGCFFKVATVVLLRYICCPLLSGWVLDWLALPVFGATFVQRWQTFVFSPFPFLLSHWILGILFRMHVSLALSLISEVVRTKTLAPIWFKNVNYVTPLGRFRSTSASSVGEVRARTWSIVSEERDVVTTIRLESDSLDDVLSLGAISATPFIASLRRLSIDLILTSIATFMLVGAPVAVLPLVYKSALPLRTSLNDPFSRFPLDVMCVFIPLPILLEMTAPRDLFKFLVRLVVFAIAWPLTLHNDVLVVRHSLAVQALREWQANSDHSSVPKPLNQPLYRRVSIQAYEFRLQLFLISAFVMTVVITTLILGVPLLCGRAVLYVLSLSIANDIYTLGLGGCFLIVLGLVIRSFILSLLSSHPANIKSTLHVTAWIVVIVKLFVFIVLMFFVLPLLVGISFDVIILIHFRTYVSDSLKLYLFQDWACGLLLVALSLRLCSISKFMFANDVKQLVHDIRINGIKALIAKWSSILVNFLFPIIFVLSLWLIVPYILFSVILPTVVCSSDHYGSVTSSCSHFGVLCLRFSYVSVVLCVVLRQVAEVSKQYFVYLHNAILDERYLIGRRLLNLERPIKLSPHLLSSTISIRSPQPMLSTSMLPLIPSIEEEASLEHRRRTATWSPNSSPNAWEE